MDPLERRLLNEIRNKLAAGQCPLPHRVFDIARDVIAEQEALIRQWALSQLPNIAN